MNKKIKEKTIQIINSGNTNFTHFINGTFAGLILPLEYMEEMNFF